MASIPRYTTEPIDPKHPPQWLIQVAIRVYDELWRRARAEAISPTKDDLCVACRDSIYAVNKALWILEEGALIKIKRKHNYHDYFVCKLGKSTRSRHDFGLWERVGINATRGKAA